MIFRARTTFPGGKFINGNLISSRWKEFTSEELFKFCKKDPSITVEIFKNGKFEPAVENLPKSIAELKMLLIDKGYSKEKISMMKKSELLELARN